MYYCNVQCNIKCSHSSVANPVSLTTRTVLLNQTICLTVQVVWREMLLLRVAVTMLHR